MLGKCVSFVAMKNKIILTTTAMVTFLLLAGIFIVIILEQHDRTSGLQIFWLVVSISMFWVSLFELSQIKEKP